MEKAVNCCICEKPIIREIYKRNKPVKNFFCSKECKQRWNEIQKEKTHGLYECTYCGKEFYRLKCFVNRDNKDNFKIYCSKECVIEDLRKQGEKSKIKLICLNCNKEYETYQIYYKRNNKNFCSNDCYNEYRKVDLYYGNKYRKIAFEIYEHKCENCNWSNGLIECLDVHHIDGDSNNICKENLIILCPTCHGILTRGWGILKNRKIEMLSKKIKIEKEWRLETKEQIYENTKNNLNDFYEEFDKTNSIRFGLYSSLAKKWNRSSPTVQKFVKAIMSLHNNFYSKEEILEELVKNIRFIHPHKNNAS